MSLRVGIGLVSLARKKPSSAAPSGNVVVPIGVTIADTRDALYTALLSDSDLDAVNAVLDEYIVVTYHSPPATIDSPVILSTNYTFLAGSNGTASLTFGSIPGNGDTMTIYGTVYTFVSGSPGGNEILIGGTILETRDNTIAVLTGDPNLNTVSNGLTDDEVAILMDYPFAAFAVPPSVSLAFGVNTYFAGQPSPGDTLELNGITYEFA